MNFKAIFLMVLVSIFSTLSITAQKTTDLARGFQLFQEKGNWGLTLKEAEIVPPKYTTYTHWKEAELLVFVDKKGKLLLTKTVAGAELLKFKGRVHVAFNRPDTLMINGVFFNAQLEEISHQEADFYHSGSFQANKHNMYFDYTYEGERFLENGLLSHQMGIKKTADNSWMLQLQEVFIQDLSDQLVYFTTPENHYGILNFDHDTYLNLLDSIPAAQKNNPNNRMKRLLSKIYAVDQLYVMPNGGFIFTNDKGKWGGGQQSEQELFLSPPVDDFFFIGAYGNRGYHVNENIVQTNLKNQYDTDGGEDTISITQQIAGTRSNVEGELRAISEVVDPTWGPEINLLDFSWSADNVSDFYRDDYQDYLVYNKADDLIYFGWSELEHHIYPNINEYGEFVVNTDGQYVNTLDSSQMDQMFFSGIFDVKNNTMLSVNNATSTLLARDNNFMIVYPEIESAYDPETNEGYLSFSKVMEKVNNQKETLGRVTEDDFIPQRDIDSLGILLENGLAYEVVYKERQMKRYFLGCPLLFGEWVEFVYPLGIGGISATVKNDSLYFGEVGFEVSKSGRQNFQLYLTDPGGLNQGVFISVVHAEDSLLKQLDTVQVFNSIDEIEPSMLLNSSTVMNWNNQLFFNVSPSQPVEEFYDKKNGEYVSAYENSSFVFDLESKQIVAQGYNKFQAVGDFIIGFRGSEVENPVWDELEMMLVIDSNGYSVDQYHFYDATMHPFELPLITDYEYLNGVLIVENSNGLKAVLNKKGKLLTDFKYNRVNYNEEKDGFDCHFTGRFKMDESGWQEFDENGDPVYEEEPYSTFIPQE